MNASTNTEQLVRQALERAGEERPVDLQALYHATRDRLEERPVRGRVPRLVWPLALGTAAAVITAALVIASGPGGDPEDRVVVSDPERVDDTFTCPVQRTTTFGPDNDDDAFLPELTNDLEPTGESEGAPRWEVERTAAGAVLRLGNDDGSLASVTTFEEQGRGFERVAVTKCTNDAPPQGGQADLVTPGLPTSPGDWTAADFEPGSVRIVDRLTYDTRGLAERHMVWLEPCDPKLCILAGRQSTSYSIARVGGDSLVPSDRTDQLAIADNVVGQDLGYRLVLLYDRAGAVRAFSWDDHDGETHGVDPVEGGGWDGQVFVFLAPAEDLAAVTVHPRDGAARTYPPDELPD